jgi:ribosome maturation factor RimP
MALIDRLREIVEPLCLDLAVELYDLELNGGVLKVTVDKAEGIGMADIAPLTREISRALDVHDPISGHFTLEVSSPGLERTLRTPAHFVRAIGSDVKVKLRPGVRDDRRVEGVLVAADDSGFVLDAVADGADQRRFSYDDIDKARTVFAWGPTPRPSDVAAKKAPAKSGAAKKKVAGSPATKAAGTPAASPELPAPADAVKVVNA